MLGTKVISYMFLYVRDLARSRTFYGAKLGLRIIEQSANSVKYDAGDVILVLNRASDYDIVLPDKNPSDYLLVFHTPDIDRTAIEISGAEVGAINRYEVGAVAKIKDPDGHPLSIYEPSEEAMTWPSAEKIRAISGTGARAVAKFGPRRVGNGLAACELIHLFLFIRDAAEAREFYGKVLGLRSLKQSACSAGGPSDRVCQYDAGGIILTTHPSEGLAKRCASALDKGIAAVFNVDDINRVVDTLRSRGLKFDSKVRRADIGKVVQFHDPNNHRFFLYEPWEAAWR